MISKNETWKSIPGFPHYEASDHGRIRSYKGHSNGGKRWKVSDSPQRILLHRITEKGYHTVSLYREDGRRNRRVHQLVLEAFLGPCPDNMEVCHNDGNTHNNHLNNLRYDTREANNQDQVLHGTCFHAKFTDEQILEIRKLHSLGYTYPILSERFSVALDTIGSICRGQTYKHVPMVLVDERAKTTAQGRLRR